MSLEHLVMPERKKAPKHLYAHTHSHMYTVTHIHIARNRSKGHRSQVTEFSMVKAGTI